MKSRYYYGWRIKDDNGSVVMYNAFNLHESPQEAVSEMMAEFLKFKKRPVYSDNIGYKFEAVPLDRSQYM